MTPLDEKILAITRQLDTDLFITTEKRERLYDELSKLLQGRENFTNTMKQYNIERK